MTPFVRALIVCGGLLPLHVDVATAQAPVSGAFNAYCGGQYELTPTYYRCPDRMELIQGETHIFAQRGEWFMKEDRAIFEGDVALSQGEGWIAADRAEFDTRTQLGIFYNAVGVSRIESRSNAPRSPGANILPTLTGQENVVYFYGEKVEKMGSKRFRISNGGFTTCVQPTPRWNLEAGTVDLKVDDYTMLRNVVFNVKDVPLLYLPIIYYPTNEDGRATGFLLPTYGSTTLLGQTIGNQFFWAINRSQDATFMHEWYSRGGQAYGGEYRYALASGSGTIDARLIDQNLSTSDTRSYSLRGGLNHTLPGNLRARANVDYFSSLQTMQTYNTDVFQASNGRRSFGGNVVGSNRNFSLNATVDYREQFYNSADSIVNGNLPRVTISRNERPIVPGSPVYFSIGGEYAGLIREQRIGELTTDSSVRRLDVTPRLRYPFKTWPFFTVNSSVSWRDTFYTRSRIPETNVIVDESLNRTYLTLQANTIGPVFNKVWDTPDNGYADRFKHTIEPFANFTWTSAIEEFDRIIQSDGVDTIVGGTQTINYGINNRFYARRRIGKATVPQEFLFVELSQTYYSDSRAARFDPRYSTSYTGQVNPFSPFLLNARATPSPAFNATVRAEVDSRYRELRIITTSGSYNWGPRLRLTGGWTRKFFIADLPGFDNPDTLDHYMNGNANIQTSNNQYGGAYSFNFDIRQGQLLQQRFTAFYNAQCCGVAAEYQLYNLGGVGGFAVQSDRRFFISFTLAGLGNFSPMNGAMGGVPR